MPETLVGYKIVKFYDHKCMWPIYYRESGVIYKMNKTTKRIKDQGPFTVFTTLDHALCFRMLYGEALLEVQYVPSKHKILWCKTNERTIFTPLNNCPPGTALADSVTPISVINHGGVIRR